MPRPPAGRKSIRPLLGTSAPFSDAQAISLSGTSSVMPDVHSTVFPPGAFTAQREPAIQARRDLRRFKQLMETGEVASAARTRKQRDEEKG